MRFSVRWELEPRYFLVSNYTSGLSQSRRLSMTRFLRTIYRFSRLPQIKDFIRKPAEKGLNKAINYKQRFSQGSDYLFVACMPKSGSTFMAHTLSELTGYRYVNLAYAYERNEQTLYLPKLIDSYSFGSVTHLHVRATESTIDLMKMFSIRPVILVRNIFDIVVSVRDHMFQEGFEIHTFYIDSEVK